MDGRTVFHSLIPVAWCRPTSPHRKEVTFLNQGALSVSTPTLTIFSPRGYRMPLFLVRYRDHIFYLWILSPSAQHMVIDWKTVLEYLLDESKVPSKAGEVTQAFRCLLSKSADLNSKSRTHAKVEGEHQLHKRLF